MELTLLFCFFEFVYNLLSIIYDMTVPELVNAFQKPPCPLADICSCREERSCMAEKDLPAQFLRHPCSAPLSCWLLKSVTQSPKQSFIVSFIILKLICIDISFMSPPGPPIPFIGMIILFNLKLIERKD